MRERMQQFILNVITLHDLKIGILLSLIRKWIQGFSAVRII